MSTDGAQQRAAMTRRLFLAGASGAAAASSLDWRSVARAADVATDDATRQAMGTRAGEATQHTAKVWVRLTRDAVRNGDGPEVLGRPHHQSQVLPAPIEQLRGACPGAAGRVRLRYGVKADLSDARVTDWMDVDASTDYSHQFDLADLTPGVTYHYESQTAGPNGAPMHAPRRGRFTTAPPHDSPSDFRFCVMTCQMYHDRDDADGHPIYPSMAKLDPAFTCVTGDMVYYDNELPRAVTPDIARYHWQRMFSLPRLVEFYSGFGTYWQKDDHDTLRDDCWPSERLGQFTFAEGQKLFRQQAPMTHGPSYRTFRWGRDLQIWLVDGRDYRSPNRMKDGPDKTIWGAEQKAWFKRTVAESTATWKILISPTPIVGPDRKNKDDNLSNAGFAHEGNEIRQWIAANVPDNFFVICGDRHWQYHSIDPATQVNEFSVGPASNSHAGGSPGYDPKFHRFHRVKGGFLSVRLTPDGDRSRIRFRLHDVHGGVVYEFARARKV